MSLDEYVDKDDLARGVITLTEERPLVRSETPPTAQSA